MTKQTLRTWAVRVVLLLVGLTVAHLGVTLFLQADLGSDPFNVLIQGLYRFLPWPEFMTHGNVHVGVSLHAGGRGGEGIEIHNNAEDCLMILVREVAGDRVIAIMNLSPYTIQAEYNTGIYAGTYRDYFADRSYELASQISEIMGPWEYRVLVR